MFGVVNYDSKNDTVVGIDESSRVNGIMCYSYILEAHLRPIIRDIRDLINS